MYYNLKEKGFSYMIWFKVKWFITYLIIWAKSRSWKKKNCLKTFHCFSSNADGRSLAVRWRGCVSQGRRIWV